MKIRFSGEIFELPPPIAAEGETLLRVTAYAPIPVPARARAHRFAFENQVAKLLFFLWREGVRLTLNKVRGTFLQRAIARERQVIFAVGRRADSDTPAVAVGPQDCPQAEIASFPSALIRDLAPGEDTAALHARVHAFLTAHPDRLADLFHHSSYSGRALGLSFDEMAGAEAVDGGGKPAPLRDLSFPTKEQAAPSAETETAGRNEVFLIGAGAYACAYVLPTLKGLPFHTVVDLNPALVASVAKRFKFRHWDTSVERAFARLADAVEPIVILAGYHSTHAEHAAMAIKANPKARIMIEKPPALDMAQASRLVALREAGAHIEIGYNRRYAPLTGMAQRVIGGAGGPLHVLCIVKELQIPDSHWYYWPSQGTRIFGNVAHWVDIAVSLIDAEPVSLVVASAEQSIVGDETSMAVIFADGSRLTLVATKLGNSLRGVQELIEIRRGDITVRIDDYITMTSEADGRRRVRRRRFRDKGHAAMYRSFLDTIAAGRPPAYPNPALLRTTRILVAAVDAVKRHRYGSVIPLAEQGADA